MRRLVLSLLLFFLTLEVGLRLVIRETELGQEVVSRFALLPIRPSEDRVRAWIAQREDDKYLTIDPRLGWSHEKGGSGHYYYANAQGIRVAEKGRVFSDEVPEGKMRLMGFGDSYVEGVGLPYEETWPSLVEDAHPEVEVINMGVQGYGTDQAYLRFLEEAESFEADAVFLGIWPDNLYRNLNTNVFWKDPVAPSMMPKPRFLLEEESGEKGLVLVRRPVPRGDALAKSVLAPLEAPMPFDYEWWVESDEVVWKPWYASAVLRFGASILYRLDKKLTRQSFYENPESPAVRLGVQLARAFAKTARERGMEPFVVVFPAEDLADLGEEPFAFTPTRALRDAGLTVLDLQPLANRALAAGESPFIEGDGHLDRGGHEMFVEALMEVAKPLLEKGRAHRTSTSTSTSPRERTELRPRSDDAP